MGPEPETIWDVLHRHKDIQYSSRVAAHISRQRQVHKLRHVDPCDPLEGVILHEPPVRSRAGSV